MLSQISICHMWFLSKLPASGENPSIVALLLPRVQQYTVKALTPKT